MLHSALASRNLSTTHSVKVQPASLHAPVQEADPMAILEQLMKKGQQKPEKTPKNEKTSKQLLGEFYGDKKHFESLLKDKGTVSLGIGPCSFCMDLDPGIPPLNESPVHPGADLTQGTTRNGEQLKDVIQDCLRNLNSSTELWGQEKPSGSSARETKNRAAKNDKPSPITTFEQNQCVLKSLEEINEGGGSLRSGSPLSVFSYLSKKKKKQLSLNMICLHRSVLWKH